MGQLVAQASSSLVLYLGLENGHYVKLTDENL